MNRRICKGELLLALTTSGEQYSGILFGKIEGKNARVYYLSVRDQEKKDTSLSVAFADGRISDKDTLKGTFYYQDSNQIGLSGPYEAHKV